MTMTIPSPIDLRYSAGPCCGIKILGNDRKALGMKIGRTHFPLPPDPRQSESMQLMVEIREMDGVLYALEHAPLKAARHRPKAVRNG
jgi:hypothetical protein